MVIGNVRRWGGLAVLIVGLTALLAACSTATTGSTGLGSMSVSFNGSPSGASPSAVVAGINGVSYYTLVTSPTTRKGLAPGSYEVTPEPFTVRRNVFDGVASHPTLNVAAGKTASDTVTYKVQPGDLWITSATSMLEYPASTLDASPPTTGATITGFGYAYAAAFDANGNLWVTDTNNNQAVEYLAASLATGSPQKGTVITGLAGPEGLAFDPDGNLWIPNTDAGTVNEYTAASLAAGSPKSSTSISTGVNNAPAGLAFDANGNLWVSETVSLAPLQPFPNSLVVEYLASSLSSGTPKTGTTITGSPLGGSLPQPVAFDANGNLWVGNFPGPGTVQEYLASSLPTGTAKPGTTLSSMPLEGALAFDTNGNLWTTQVQNNAVVAYTAASLTNSSPTTKTTISVSNDYGLAFNPPPYQLPLSH